MFSLKLEYFGGEKKFDHELPQEYECLEEAVMEICDQLSDDNDTVFEVEGFGVDWPVDVQTDLSTIIPQIEDAIVSLRGASYSTIQFYEQGIEKEIEFLRDGKTVFIKCRDLISGEIIGSEKSSLSSLEKMLIGFLLSFIACVKKKLPSFRDNSFFSELSLSVERLAG